MTPSRRRWRHAAISTALVMAVVGVAWCFAYARTSAAAWSTPIGYGGDSLFLTAYLKAARDGHVLPAAGLQVPELNAPYGANWNDHPRTLRPVFLAAGLLSRGLGLFATMNLLLLLAHLLAGASMFLVARRLGARPEWAAAAGVVFGLSYFLFWRTLDHLDLAFVWHLPLCALVVSWGFSRRGIALRSRRFALAAAVAVIAGFHDPYYACLFAQFLLLAAAAQMLRRRARGGALPLLALAAIVAGTFLLDSAGALAYQLAHGRNPAALRPYGNLERFALKPLELLVPPIGSGLGGWGRLAHVHWEGRLYKGESGAAYLGLVGGGALLWLGMVTVAGAMRGGRRPPSSALAVLWILGFSVVGGLNQLLGLAGFDWLRASNRFSVWILVVALLFLATRRFPRGAPGVVLAVVVTAVALADQLPRHRPDVERTRLQVANDREFVRGVEALLPAGAMVFMMPVIEFPEGRAVLHAQEYEHLRPYLHSRRLRFSFGTDKGRARESWQARLAAVPAPQLVAALEACGFSGILLNRLGYVSSGTELLEQMRAAGRPVVLKHPAGDYVLVALRPRSDPVRPWTQADEASPDAARQVCGQDVPPLPASPP